MEGGAGQVCRERGGGAGAGREKVDRRARARQVRAGWAGPPSGRGLQVRGHAPKRRAPWAHGRKASLCL